MTHTTWFEANPQLLQRELDALAAMHVVYTVDETLRSQGILQIGLTIDPATTEFGLPASQEPLQLEVTFPDNYPYFRPEVLAPTLALARHQNPIGKNLCLLPRESKHWNVEWTLAEFLQAQLAKALEKGAITDEQVIAADPNEQAEPATAYYAGSQYPVIFDSTAFDAIQTGPADLVILGRIRLGIPEAKAIPTRMAVLENATPSDKPLSSLPVVFQKLFPVRLEGYALRLAERPPHENVHDNIRWLRGLLHKCNGGVVPTSRPLPGVKDIGTNGNAVIKHVWALNFPEEVGPGRMGMGWLFLVESMVEIAKATGKKGSKERKDFAYFAQAARSGPQDVQIRVPRLTHLPACTVAIVGLGALGAPAAIEFARNQVGRLRLMDFDSVDPATTVRWPLGASAYGEQKTGALEEFINEQYPSTEVQVFDHKIGNPPVSGQPTEQQKLHMLLDGASLLFDASAETGVNHFLSNEARQRGIPYISLYTTPGAWGGLVMRVVPGKTQGCWMCLQYAKDSGVIPVPKSDAAGQIQAPGCGDLTFTGASFDLQNVSLAAVRLAVSTLCGGTPSGYPDVSWDVGVLSMVDDNNLPIPPSWQTFSLKAHPQCPYCSSS